MCKDITNKIEDDFSLLELLIHDCARAEKIYQPGIYWANKSKSAINEIRRHGLSDFRGATNGASTSYGDNAYIDIRSSYDHGIRALFVIILRKLYPFNILFNDQINLTKGYFNELVEYKSSYLKNNKRVKLLLSKYNMPRETVKGGCLSFGDFDGKIIAHSYIRILDTLDRINEMVDLSKKKTFFEIGGGFGVNVHLLIELFGIKKIIYLDIVPNLYVGTQYLKSYYGVNVIDYARSKHMDQIKFSDSDELEIFCIAPQQIVKVKTNIDLFHNAHSFVEMPIDVIKNYAENIKAILSKSNGTISLVSYDGYDLNTTLDPNKLLGLFSKSAITMHYPTLVPSRSHFHIVSPPIE